MKLQMFGIVLTGGRTNLKYISIIFEINQILIDSRKLTEE